MNVFERVLAAVAPVTAAARARARLDIVRLDMAAQEVRGYDAGRRGPRTQGWRTPATDARVETAAALGLVRQRARDLVRNDPFCKRAVEVLVSQIVGTGIVPSPQTGDADRDKVLTELWTRFADEADAGGQLDVYGLQALAVRGMIESGESLVRFRTRRTEDRLAVPLQLQVMEGDHIDSTRDGLVPVVGADVRRTVSGIAFDRIGRRSGYWLYPDHPGGRTAVPASVLIDAAEVAHLYRITRPGQVRGISELHAIVLHALDLKDVQEAARIKARIEACLSLALENTGEPGPLPGKDVPDSPNVHELGPGFVLNLKPGQKAVPIVPSSTAQLDAIMTQTQLGMAAGLNVTFDQMTGRLDRANYSSLKAGKTEQRVFVEALRWQTIVPMLLAPLWRKFIDHARLAGVAEARGTVPVTWIAPRFEPVDPYKDGLAEQMDLEAGLLTWSEAVHRRGLDPAAQIQKLAEERAALAAAGIGVTIGGGKAPLAADNIEDNTP